MKEEEEEISYHFNFPDFDIFHFFFFGFNSYILLFIFLTYLFYIIFNNIMIHYFKKYFFKCNIIPYQLKNQFNLIRIIIILKGYKKKTQIRNTSYSSSRVF